MQLVKVLSIAISLLMSAIGLKAETPSIEEFSNGITAFLCENNKAVISKLPLIFSQSEDKWVLNLDSSTSVTKIEKGFMLNFPQPNQGIGILSANQNGSWKYEFLGEKESWETTCSKPDNFTRTLIEIISPRIIESTTSFSFSEYKEMITNNNIIKSLRIDLDKSFGEIERLASELSQAKTELYKKSEVADIIINKMKLCWNPPVGFENGTTNSITLGLKFDIDGKLLESPTNLTPVSEVGSLIAFEAARRAVILCSPYNELDPRFYIAWKEIELIF
ncbi:hypothetical protein N9P92_02335 [Amylibacter sp.]|nr:hypothetical protein [Amylibacter sp.]